MEQSVIEKIEKSDFYQEIIRKEQADLLAKRQEAAQALGSIDKDTETRVRGIIKAIAEAGKVAAEIEKEAQEARARVDALRAERTGAGAKAEREKRAHHDFLLETADTRIDQAIQWFNDRFDALRRGTADRQSYSGKFDPLSWTREVSGISNHKARVAALSYCRDSIKKLEAMKLQPEVSQKELRALAEGLPDTAMVFEETSTRKTEKDFADVPFWAKFPSDEQHRLEMDGLLKKADSLKHRRTA